MAELRVPYRKVNMWLVPSKDGQARLDGPRWWLHWCDQKRDLVTDKSGAPTPCACGMTPPTLPTAVPTTKI